MELDSFNAFRIHAATKDSLHSFHAGIEKLHLEDLTEGDVVVRVQYSAVNYKDALAGSGAAPILRKSPLNGGIDLVGVVEQSSVPAYRAGDRVLAQGSGLSEIYDGGFSQYARLPEAAVLAIPPALTEMEAIAIGTAGFTAALSIHKMEQNGQKQAMGDVLVTGASGGVGSMAVHLLSELGYRCVAATRKQESHDYLSALGASKVIDMLEPPQAPLAKQRWGAVLDNLGGNTLVRALSETCAGGNVVSVGLAQSDKIAMTVMPFIIRGVSLLGVSSANCPVALRKKIWHRYAPVWKPQQLARMVSDEIGLEDLPRCFEHVLNGKVSGRVLVDPHR